MLKTATCLGDLTLKFGCRKFLEWDGQLTVPAALLRQSQDRATTCFVLYRTPPLVTAPTESTAHSQGYRRGRKSAITAVMRWGQFKLVSTKEVFGCRKSRETMCFLATSWKKSSTIVWGLDTEIQGKKAWKTGPATDVPGSYAELPCWAHQLKYHR